MYRIKREFNLHDIIEFRSKLLEKAIMKDPIKYIKIYLFNCSPEDP